MRPLFVALLCTCLATPYVRSQILVQEGFESADSLPAGWSVWNNAPFPVHEYALWTIRDSGIVPTGMAGIRTKAHTGRRAGGISYWAGVDSNSGIPGLADGWLVTRRVSGVQTGDVVRFWGSGGSGLFFDSLQVWLSPVDSTPTGLIGGIYLGSVVWPAGSVYGVFTQHQFSLAPAAGLDIWIGFRYVLDVRFGGFYVHLDDITVEPGTPVAEIGDGIPDRLRLEQNYPNPFNPSTTIRYSLPHAGRVTLSVHDLLGRTVAVLVDGERPPGDFSASWEASGLSSGVYFCRLRTAESVVTRRMMLVR